MKCIRVSRSVSTFRVLATASLLTAIPFLILGARQWGGADRYLTHISTDKPIYRGGERLYARGVILHAAGHSPLAESPGPASFEIKGPKGDTVVSGIAPIADSVAALMWDIPEDQAGGEYKLRISHPSGNAPAERKFDIRAYRPPRLKSRIVFARDGYGPGDRVTASLAVERAEGGFPAGAKVFAGARVDGEEVWKGESAVGNDGASEVSFRLPSTIARGEGVLVLTIQDGGVVETAAKTIPILLQTIDVSIYPEGGDIVAGLPNRVYIEGRTPSGKPADMAGFVVDASGKEVAAFRTEHEGRGRFSFVPARGERYALLVTEPSGIRNTFPLPPVKESGVSLSSVSDVTPKHEDIVVRVAATTDGVYHIALTQRGRELSFKRLSLKAGRPAEAAFTVPKSLDGVIVATVYDDRNKPLAERLLFRRSERKLDVKVSADRTDYVPGEKVTLRVTTTDESGTPAGAVVGLNVTDSSVLEMVEKREQAPRLPVMVLLENDVRDLADAHVYLDESNPKAALATDLLLGAQGWRRFAAVNTVHFVDTYKDAARRAFAIATPSLTMSNRPQTVIFRSGPAAAQRMAPPAIVGGSTPGTEYIHGFVMDASNALIPGVTMQAANLATKVVVTTISNESGVYVFPPLPPGMYRVTASLPGFQTSVAPNLQLGAGAFLRQDFPMEVATVNTMVGVSVSADGLVMAASHATVGEILPQGRMRDLPLVGNNVLELAKIINPDLVGEIRLILSPVDAELGRGTATVNATTRPRPNIVSGVATVREYAHAPEPNRDEGERADFSETVYWNAGVRTDPSTGVATVSFNLSDSVTAFRVIADAFSSNGALGSGVSHVESVQPFFIEPKMPLLVTAGDVVQLPVGMINGTSGELRDVEVDIEGAAGLRASGFSENPKTLRPRERARRVMQLRVGADFSGSAEITLKAKAGRYRDTVTRTLDVQAPGFPHEEATGGILEGNGSESFEFRIPEEMAPGSATSTVTVYPTPLATLTDALKSLVREPHGCFEQTSATSYPLVMAQQYFLTHQGVDPALIERAKGLLDGAYKKLLGFQTRSHGYEWFGADPGHEALTAYGLMQFTDMAKVRRVDSDMLSRTRTWLLSRRDGKGGFLVNPRALDTFGRAPADTTNAYIVWALVEAGEKGLEREVAQIRRGAESTQDSYILALSANILHATGDKAGAARLMARLARSQEPSGIVNGASTSITRSGGRSLAIETTALSALAWMREAAYAGNAEKAVKWIAGSNTNGMFGSTQSTILALRSIVAHDKANARPKAPGRIVLSIDGKTVGEPIAFTANTQSEIVMPDFGRSLAPGRHTATLRMEGGSRMPFSIAVKYHTNLPDSAPEAQVGIGVTLRDERLVEGAVTEARVAIVNKSAEAIPTPVAVVGIPGGLEVRHDQLKELVKTGRIDAYEVMGSEVVLYWRFLPAGDRFDLPLSLLAAVPGTYTGPASRAYLYYTNEYKNWAPGLQVSIAPR